MEKRISGHTGLMALFGTPVGHSGSPAMYNFSFQHDGLDYAYMAFDVNVEQMPKVFEAIRLLNMRGGNFTMPCKNVAAELVDKLSPAAEIIGACNVFVNDGGVITGHVTDGVGFVKNLELNGISVKDKKTVILGAGGAATAIQVQLALDGAKEVKIFNPKDDFFTRAEGTKAKLAKKCPDCVVTVEDLEDKEKLAEAVNSCDIVINATIMGMEPYDDVSLIDKSLYRKDLIVADTVYSPEKTKMILEAEESGCVAVGGKGMLEQQGAVNYELFVGKKMPLKEYQRFQEENK
ncbi:shikimate dehydrogenase (NADP(+)) [Lachnospiraceae bacterium]|uniref:shikimate dehydrogenase n=1 Tax=Extibacter sp. GGCC_0201 TaxID=2731209 RepID=UPI001AA179D2|nr:shikimate dehydrogenase [Extibacter sp. GGCC_0201]MBO1722660.1 shikimate dehydrogenase [Extibacter sp. GGCC_0201]BDF34250.1 shikimate dehydrogenase (NADP(+)) [Lachnospiraceae bacterium]BDF38254.1 shikimate dehydrogenase (NADP(+)) [Lachnospiraceae bacterium]